MEGKRFITKDVLCQTTYCDMNYTEKMLYIYLVLSADDDGFVGNPKKIQQTYTYNRQALSVLEKNGFIITFPNDVCVLTHWNMMNKVPPSKHVDTIYTAEKARLRVDKKGVYHLIAQSSGETACLPGGAERVTAADEQRNRIKENRIEENRNTSTQYISDNHSSETKADKAAAYTAEFEEVWALYPKKINKYKAFIAFRKALETGAAVADIKAGIERYRDYIARKKIKERYIKHGSTFFNQRGWEDDYDIEIPSTKTELDKELLALF